MLSLALCLLATSYQFRVQIGHSGTVTSVSFSPNGEYLASGGGDDHTVRIWQLATGTEVRVLTPLFSKNQKMSVAFGAGVLAAGSVTEAGGYNGAVDLYDVTTGALIRKLVDRKLAPVFAVAMSPDSLLVAAGDRSFNVYVFDSSSGRLVHKLSTKNKAISLQFTPDGKLVTEDYDHKTECFDMSTGAALPAQPMPDRWLSRDGAIKASSKEHVSVITLTDTLTGRIMRTLGGALPRVFSMAVSPDDRYVVTGGIDNTMRVWDLSIGAAVQLARTKTGEESLFSAAISADAKTMSAAGFQVQTWETHTGKTLWYSATKAERRLDRDGRMIAALADDKVTVSELRSGRTLQAFKVPPDSVMLGYARQKKLLAVSRPFKENTLCAFDLYDLTKGKVVATFTEENQSYNFCFSDAWFSEDDSKIVTTDNSGGFSAWDVASQKFERRMGGMRPWSLGYAHGKVVAGYENGDLEVYDFATGTRENNFVSLHNNAVTAVAIGRDGKRVFSASLDGTTKISSLTNDSVITLLSGHGEWLVYTHDGYFDASRRGGPLVAMIDGMTPYAVDQFALRNNRPDIILQRLGLAEQGLIDHLKARTMKRLAKAGITAVDGASELHVPVASITSLAPKGRTADLTLSFADDRYALKSYQIFVNDVPIAGGALSEKSASTTTTIVLSAGANKIEVSCTNDQGAESFRALKTVSGPEAATSALYFIGFGVSKYADPSLALRYADKDATDLAAIFGKMRGFSTVHSKVFVNAEVTPESIKEAKALLKDAKVDDTFVLFIAGHGVYERTSEATYYYLTHGAKVNDLAHTAASFDLVEDLLQGVAPRRKLFLMDTCESGELDDETTVAASSNRALASRGIKRVGTAEHPRQYLQSRERFIYNDITRRSGAIVFSSSRGGELSYEGDAVKNGFFTSEIKAALTSGVADSDKNGVISVDELRVYVSAAVAKKTAELQHPTVDRDNLSIQIAFPKR